MNVMLELKKSLSVVSDFIGQRSVIYIDYPIYGNGGDLLIMHGAMKFFEGRGIKVLAAFTCSNCDYSHIDKLLQSNDCCIVLNGGGNFGDIYERHQAVRTEIYKKYQNQRILLLPQSAHYEDSNNVEKDSLIISALTDSLFLARDKETKALFESFGVPTKLCPDMAHELYGKLAISSKKTTAPFHFIRNDIERDMGLEQYDNGLDWVNVLSFFDKLVIRVIVNLQKRTNIFGQLSFKFWAWYVALLSNRFSLFFSSHEKIVTSRMHGHILSCLVEVPSVVIDNTYGKNSRYVENWTKHLAIQVIKKK